MFRYNILLIFLLQLITLVNSYKLIGRSLHTANYINDKIYFLGGETDTASYTNDFFYLDVSAPFTLNSLPIVDLTRNVQIAKLQRASSTVCGPNKDTIFLFGGWIDIDESAASLVYTFNISVPQWTNTNIRGPQPNRRVASSVVCDDKDARMYIFGGTNNEGYKNDFDILDTDQITWSLGNRINIPPPMDLATANLLSDGKIVYLGGYSNGQLISMSKIYLYDTINDEWLRMITMDTPPNGRAWHSAVLTHDGRIIVYGGVPVSSYDKLSVLDTTVQPFRWSIPEIIFTPSSAPYMGHTATLVGNLMIVAFGLIDKGSAPDVYSNQILMLDISDKYDYKWVMNFTPNTTVPDPVPAPSPAPDSSHKALFISFAVIIIVIIICSLYYYIYYVRYANARDRVPLLS
ncbi:17716_t:CDS:2 [Funneliformis geosporum]|uniref:1759_t:CDS:1 n=1 Tax=Funneliformis geosporum TaxID=1117311 RepID=A0A9W4T0B0_9GLOM|nr:1759_t:CDS:2 [Funneliformis geosporum]CAI2185903.1 17716_t:CDS:2 [Funneliformis geosporum]